MFGIAVTVCLASATFSAQAGSKVDKEAMKLDARATEIIKRDFRDKGIAKADRVNQDALQAACSKYEDDVPVDMKIKLEDEQAKQIKWPADGNFMGDWKAGEKLAQSGKGMTWSDKPDEPAGGNCYNCHQLSSKEIAYGTIGPSLLNYAKKQGTPEKGQRRAYGRIYNAKAYAACANMPRFGHMGILSEAQIKDLVALLMDPESPVNK
ncbi:MAG: sulfur oxidation c-type cytochrome SoxX [Nitrosomonadales bacterium]|nr:sulfur oxidation c-type cytochrome SoxX [Nitrosomonadales bacterium]